FPKIVDVQIHIDPLDEGIKESMLAKLPERSVIEQDLASAWQGIAESGKISQIKLHYLDRLIEIDLVLPAELCNSGHQGEIEKLQESTASLDYIGKVNIYYQN
ncbi:MAG: hypothetical protein PVJ78_14120, partial [Gammaproteobacteria bacterium]